MTLLADHDVWAATLKVLRAHRHDVVTAADLDLDRAPDRTLLWEAADWNRLLLIRDRDFGRLVFVRGHSAGILFVRITPATQDAVHEKLRRVLDAHAFDDLPHAFIVVEPVQHRIRRST